jgi:hypothetical protein
VHSGPRENRSLGGKQETLQLEPKTDCWVRDSYAEIKARGEESGWHNENQALRRQNERASRQNQISSTSEINQLEKL